MSERPEIWLVLSGEELVAELEVEGVDPPWFYGRVVRRDGFWPLQPLVDREQLLADRVDHDPAAWATVYRRVRREVQLLRPDGHVAPEFILHIDGPRARWRCWNRESTNWLDEQLAATAPATAAPERIVRYLLAAMIGALVAVMALPGVALAHPLHHQQSSNWAGYAVTAGKPFRSVSGSWVQPAAICDQQQNTYAAFWVGIGGFKQNSQKLEQIGTEADCSAVGHATSYAWYELVPHAPVTIRLQIRPGDRITAQVRLKSDLVRLRIKNLTSHRTFAKTIPFAAPDATSAEWIVEAPSECNGQQCQPLPLTDFNTVQFTQASATTAGDVARTITNPLFTTTELTLSPGAGAIGPPLPPGPQPGGPAPVSYTPSGGGAAPTRPSHDGDGFTVTFTPDSSLTAP
jgi:hypothetical protein